MQIQSDTELVISLVFKPPVFNLYILQLPYSSIHTKYQSCLSSGVIELQVTVVHDGQ